MARKWRGIQDGTSSGHLCVCPEQQSLGDRPKPQVLAPNLLFPCVQLHLQGLQHPAPPYGAFLPCAPVLRRGCKHPGLQSSPGKHGDQQQHQAAAAGNGGGRRGVGWQGHGLRPGCFLTLLPDCWPCTAFPMRGLSLPPVSVAHS